MLGGKVGMRFITKVNGFQIFSVRVDRSLEPMKADYLQDGC